VAQLLHYATGVTSPHAVGSGILLRAAPSAGALYPVDVYLAARAVEGLEPGVYYYDPHQHALLRTGDANALRVLANHVLSGRRAETAPLSLVLGATFDRTVVKYGSRAYRYVALDTGHVAANVALAGAAVGMPCTLQPLFEDDVVAKIVGAGSGEGALLVLSCATGVEPSATEPAGRLVIPAHEPPALPPHPEDQELCRLSQRVTSWAFLGQVPREIELTAVPPPPETDPVALPAPAPAERDLFEVIAARRSFRAYSSRAVAAEQFAGVLADAQAFAPRVRGQALIELYAFVRAVDSVPPGLYRYHPDLHALERARTGQLAQEIQSAGLSQELLGRAAFVLAWAARMDVIEKTDGARGYRHALLDAGLAGEHAYLSAVARRLGICGVGAFHDDAVNRLLGSKNGARVALYLQGVGQRE
jgi:SagB-type dehydrogenase family enzyme